MLSEVRLRRMGRSDELVEERSVHPEPARGRRSGEAGQSRQSPPEQVAGR